MAVSPDILHQPSVPQEQVSTSPGLVLPLRRSRSMAESIAWHTQASETPIEQVVSNWARQKGTEFVIEILDAPVFQSMPETERTRLISWADYTVAMDFVESIGFVGWTRDIDDKRFHHKSLLE